MQQSSPVATQSQIPEPIGHETAIALLKSAITQQRIATAYLFTGRAGVGKHQAAMWFANELLQAESKPVRSAIHPNLLHVEPTFNHEGKLYTLPEATAQKIPHKGTQIRIEQVRQLSADLQRKPLYAKRSVVIVDKAETMAEAAANALLKTLEEPGGNVLILVVNQIDRILPTIISRCQVVSFYPLTEVEMGQALEGMPQCLQYSELIEFGQGSPGQVIGAYRQLQALQVAGFTGVVTGTISECFLAAKQVCELDMTLQQWLLDWWQVTLWNRTHSTELLQNLENARRYLKQNCSPQSVWEIAFLKLRSTHRLWEVPEVEIVPEVIPEVEIEVAAKQPKQPKEAKKLERKQKTPTVVKEVEVVQRGLFD